MRELSGIGDLVLRLEKYLFKAEGYDEVDGSCAKGVEDFRRGVRPNVSDWKEEMAWKRCGERVVRNMKTQEKRRTHQ